MAPIFIFSILGLRMLGKLFGIGDGVPRGQILGIWSASINVLNNDGLQDGSGDDAVSCKTLASSLRRACLRMKADFMDESGSTVDYAACRGSASFQEYKTCCSKLKTVDIRELNEAERKSFFINIYNSLIIHVLVEGLLPDHTSTISRIKLYARNGYNISGNVFSLNDIENGILRSNRRSAVPLTRLPFDDNDIRRQFMCAECDPRIHFALNCGAKSCPPIAVYSDESSMLDQQLDLATRGFLESNTEVNVDEGIVTLSMLFSWYKQDFGNDELAIVQWVQQHANGALAASITQLLTKRPKPLLKFADYDWSMNSS